ncbi:MAG: ribosome maturation factor RimP [Synergistales bacterium]|nr:ribosome maturation factor RimP [Synergistales bacterium]
MSETKWSHRFEPEIRSITESLGYEFVGIEFLSESGRKVFRIYIDSLGGITVKDCETVSRKISQYMDEENFFNEQRYFLEVSSPGLERPLFRIGDYEKHLGRKASIRTGELINGRKKFCGVIKNLEGSDILFQEDNGDIVPIPFSLITKANLVFEIETKNQKSNSRRMKGD